MPLFPPQRFRKTEYIHRTGTAANKPAAADVLPGTLYLSTDTGALERSDGVAWIEYAQTTYNNLTVTGVFTSSSTENINQSTINTLNVTGSPILLTSGAIRFPAVQVPSANANDLDDYEEGNWTPAYLVGGSGVGITYTTQSGVYTKIGNKVHIWGKIVLSSKGGGAGVITITGVPFASANTEIGSFDPAANYSGSFTGVPFIVMAASTLFVVQSTAGARGQPVNADFTNTSDMRFNIEYTV